MPKVVLFIATSLDGYIARSDGTVDWLFHDGDYRYTEFMDSLDAVVADREQPSNGSGRPNWTIGSSSSRYR